MFNGYYFFDYLDDNTLIIASYLYSKYGTFDDYLRQELGGMVSISNFKDEVYSRCSLCGEKKKFSEFYKTKDRGLGIRQDCKKCVINRNVLYAKDNPEKIKVIINNRRAREKNLPHSLNNEQEYEILLYFDNRCAVSYLNGKLELDHFIPLAWYHGGTYHGNIYPLNESLNSSKGAKNPFKWVKTRQDVDIGKFNELVEYLAELNGLTVDEYRQFVYWCEANKRTVEEVRQDPRPSIEIWREATLSNESINEKEVVNA